MRSGIYYFFSVKLKTTNVVWLVRSHAGPQSLLRQESLGFPTDPKMHVLLRLLAVVPLGRIKCFRVVSEVEAGFLEPL